MTNNIGDNTLSCSTPVVTQNYSLSTVYDLTLHWLLRQVLLIALKDLAESSYFSFLRIIHRIFLGIRTKVFLKSMSVIHTLLLISQYF